MSEDDELPTIARFYTKAIRIPVYIGKLSGNFRIPGGPYTVTQAVGGLIALWVLWQTIPLWAKYNLVANLAIGIGAVWGLMWLLGRIPVTGRNPLLMVRDVVAVVTTSPKGLASGGDLRSGPARGVMQARSPRRMRSRVVVDPQEYRPDQFIGVIRQSEVPRPVVALPKEPTTEPITSPPAPAATPHPVRPIMTGVQQLLAAASAQEGTSNAR